MLPKSNGDGTYIVNRKTGITLGLLILLLSGAVWFVTNVNAQTSKIDVINSEISYIQEDIDKFVPRTEINIRFDSIDDSLSRIEKKLDKLT